MFEVLGLRVSQGEDDMHHFLVQLNTHSLLLVDWIKVG